MRQHRTRSNRRRSRRHPRPPTPAERPLQAPPSQVGPGGPENGPNPLAEAGAVAGHGPATTFHFLGRRLPLPRALDSLRERDFRIFWSSQLISLSGTWMQSVAQSWLVLQLTGSALALGLVNALQFAPILLFSVLGGVVADRLPKQRILLATQSTKLVLAFVLGALTLTDQITLGILLTIAVLFGLVTAVDLPTRQAFVVELVRGRGLSNAVALNSAAFNGARLIGPAIAGLVIGTIGLAGCFFANGVGFAFPIVALFAIRAGREPFARGVAPMTVSQDLRAGFRYVWSTPVVRTIMVTVAVIGTFGMNVLVLVPLLAADVLQVGAEGFGFLTAATGVGALAAALTLAHYDSRVNANLLLASAGALGLVQVTLAATRVPWLAAVQLALLGFAMVGFTTLANIVLQLRVPDALRGRVMSLYTTVFAGTAPVGALLSGAIAQTVSVPAAFLTAGVLSLGAAAIAFWRRPR